MNRLVWEIPGPGDPQYGLEANTGMAFLAAAEDVVGPRPEVRKERCRTLKNLEGTSEAIFPEPINHRWHEATARLAERKGKWFTARFHLDRLIADRPDDALLRLCRALVHWDLALWAFDRAIAERPGDWWLHDDRAAVFEELGKSTRRDADRTRAVEYGADSFYLARLTRDLDGKGDHARADGLRDQAVARPEPGANSRLMLELAGDQMSRIH